ncbi:hypothetical protein [Chryseobacterium caseinilyticum]|uniref:Uncharacterized protein n=1 Tax=Chryseobacterium caseinilyticum TaxID=2771428 RepID=A0ABR8ZEQ6_9FLAO|nr:hypothetical protein [Chryseobacterium caseinilyticum]MBD8083760.1 hypothetical protein [Chryseobacterium caseinilyticum]
MRKTIWVIASALLLSNCKKEVSPTHNAVVNRTTQQQDSAETVSKAIDSTSRKEAKIETFDFITELCTNKGYFDSNTYSRREIEDTYKLWFNHGGISLSTPSVFKPQDLYKVRREKDAILAQLDADFLKSKKNLENLVVVKTPYWQNIKSAYLKMLKQDYQKNKIQIESFSNPSVLLNNSFTKNCQNYAKALNSSDAEIMEEWRKLRGEMSKRNGNPAKVMRDFESNAQSADWKDFATADLITFGWGNCANQDVERPLHDEKMNKQFESLFTKTDSECDEP